MLPDVEFGNKSPTCAVVEWFVQRLTNHRAEQIKTMEVAGGRSELRAVTGPDYGRIYDQELVSAVQRIAGNGTLRA